MKILFLCGCLEPGQDGVGDYSRRLGIELIRQGHTVSLLSLHDTNVVQVTNEIQAADDISIEVMRIPNTVGDHQRFSEAREFIDLKCPEWVSLQFVPFAFQPKGLPFKLARQLKMLGEGRKWHIMFHELWVETEEGRFLRMKVLGYLQMRIIKRMLGILSPSVIHTHLPFYQKGLNKIGSRALDLSLFSNIAEFPNTNTETGNDVLRVCFFSQVASTKEIVTFLRELKEKVEEKKRKLEIVLLGGSKSKMTSFKKEFEVLFGPAVIVSYTGFLSPEQISAQLAESNLGITPVPVHVLGKSGSVAAFISHGVPVAAPRNRAGYAHVSSFFKSSLQSSIVVKPDFLSIEKAKKSTEMAKNDLHVSTIARKFLLDLN